MHIHNEIHQDRLLQRMSQTNLLLDECDCLARIQAFRAGLRTIHDCVATVQLEGVIKSCDIGVRAMNVDLWNEIQKVCY